jgi:L-asparaginase / beta-aspartyl-peptidase
MSQAIVVHGGAWHIPRLLYEGNRAGCRRAALAGWQVLQEGGSALDAVEAAVRVLEDDPHFEAGFGASLSVDGEITLDAGIMDGATLAVGVVADIPLIQHPITLARRVLESPHVFLQGEGAVRFAAEHGIPQCHLFDLLTGAQLEAWRSGYKDSYDSFGRLLPGARGDTVGAVALDSRGHLAAATSTSGLPYKRRGRVGDSPLIGCGFYADEYGAGSASGHGEDFMRLTLLQRAITYIGAGHSAPEAAHYAVDLLKSRVNGIGGLILLDRAGHVGIAHSSPNIAFAYMKEGMNEPVSGVRVD